MAKRADITFDDDGLDLPTIGSWGVEKHELFGTYAEMFSSAMKKKWDSRVYVDLYAASGLAKIENTNRVVPGSPIIAATLKDPFDLYIFCEAEADRLATLRTRIGRFAPNVAAEYILGDANAAPSKIKTKLPKFSKTFKVLSFIFVDPYRLENLTFKTIRLLSTLIADFLVLIPSFMDANRNTRIYLDPKNQIVENFLGLKEWRDHWAESEQRGDTFGIFVADQFGKQMASLGFQYRSAEEMVLVRNPEKNAPLYHLAFFTKNDLGRKFWKQARKYSSKQLSLL